MDTAPKVGDRVKVNRWHRYFPCTGTVTRVHQVERYDIMNPAWFDPDFLPVPLGLVPERDWKVTVKVDVIPPDWDYFDDDEFIPSVFELEALEDVS